MFVYPNHTSYHRAIVLKMGVPIVITQDQIGSAVWAMLVGGMKESAQIRLNA